MSEQIELPTISKFHHLWPHHGSTTVQLPGSSTSPGTDAGSSGHVPIVKGDTPSSQTEEGSGAFRRHINDSEPALENRVESRSESISPELNAKHSRAFMLQFICICVAMGFSGWNDATTGPLIPRIQAVYNVGFGVVSLLFVAQSIGYVSGALSNVFLSEKIGFGRILALGSLFSVFSCAIEAPAPPFPVFCVGYALNGYGMAIVQGQCISYVAGFKDNKELRVGIMQAAYGAGALLSPIVATQFAESRRWSFHYIVSLGLALLAFILILSIFRGMTQEESLAKVGQTVDPAETSDRSKFRQTMTLRAVHVLAFFIFMYVGTEVTIGGWIVSYIVLLRNGGASTGYISTGFWGGIMLGRLVLLWINQKVGERRVVFVYCALAMGLELVVWFVPSLPGSAVAVSLIGLLLGPFYPIAMTHASRVLPSWLLTSSVAWIGGFGQIRSAVLPFLTGAMSGKYGIQSLQPLLMAMLGTMFVLWACVPNAPRRID